MRCTRTVGATLLVALLACGGTAARDGTPARDGAPGSGNGSRDSTATGSAAPAANLKGMTMLPAFRAHVDSVAADPSMMRSSMPGHRAEVQAMVTAMHADMTGTGMHSDAAYEALADSVVAGAASLGQARGPEFERLVMRHVDQMRRLASVYETKANAMTK